MCIERLWPYWLSHWRTQYYGILTIIALYIVYLITFGCYLKAKWFIVYLWKRYSSETFSECSREKPKGGREWRWKFEENVYVRLHDRMRLWSCVGGSCFVSARPFWKWGPWHSRVHRVAAVALQESRLVCIQCFLYIVNNSEFASLCFSLFIGYCFFDILYKSYISLAL